MNAASSIGKRAVQTSFAVAGIVPVVAGLWGWTSNVKLEGIEIANVRWGKAPFMLKVDQVDCDMRPWPLLGGGPVSSLMVSVAGLQIFEALVL